MKKLIFIIGFLVCSIFVFGQRRTDTDLLIVRDSTNFLGNKLEFVGDGIIDSDGINLGQLSDSIQNNLFVQPLDSLYLNPDAGPTSTRYAAYADTIDNTWSVPVGTNGVVMQINQESLGLKYNGTGGVIEDGSVCRGVGVVNGRISIEKALAGDRHTALVVATQEIADGTNGLCVELYGKVRGINTSGLSLGQVWLSSTTPGALTNTPPPFPSYAYPIGAVTVVDAVDGVIDCRLDGIDFNNIIRNSWNGAFNETFNFSISSNGTVITGSLERSDAAGDLTQVFSDGYFDYDVFPTPKTIVLTEGADDNEQLQYVYIDKTTKELAVSTSYWPATEHIPVDIASLQTAATVQTRGASRNQNINNHIASLDDLMGKFDHFSKRLRSFASDYENGIDITVVGSGTTTVYATTTGGDSWQLHLQPFDAKDISTDFIKVENDFADPGVWVDDFTDITTDASGGSLNNNSGSVVIIGINNSMDATDQLIMNMPTGTYNTSGDAIADDDKKTVYSIPQKYKGTAILLYRLTFSITGGGTVWTLNDTEDLRGLMPSTAPGGGATGGGVSVYLGLLDTYSSFSGLAETGLKVNGAENALGATQWTEDGSGNFDIVGTATINTIANASGDFVTAPNGGGLFTQRTAAEVLSDIGAADASSFGLSDVTANDATTTDEVELTGGLKVDDITGITTDGDVTITPNGTGNILMAKDLELNFDLIDINDSPGTAGQVLSSLGSGNGVDWIDAAAGISFGTTTQIPYMNAGGTDFLYSANMTYDGTDLVITGNVEGADGTAGQDLISYAQSTDGGEDFDYNTLIVADEAYNASGWNGDLTVPTKNAIRDKIETMPTEVREYWLGSNYTYESLTSTPPSTGEIRFNTSNPASATSMYVFQTDEDGFDRAAELGALASGDWVSVSNTSGNYFRYILSGAPTDNGTWWTIPVTFKNGVSSLSDEEDIAFDIFYIGSGGGGVTSVGYTSSDFAITGSPITSSGTFVANLDDDAISNQTELASGLASTDELLVSDAGVLKRMDISVIETYMQNNLSFGSGEWQSVTNGIAPATISDVVFIGSTTGTGGGTYELDLDGRGIVSEEFIVASFIKSDYNIVTERATIGTPAADIGFVWMDSDDDKLYFTNSATTFDLTAGGGSPGGSDTQVQFNDGGSFGGDADFIWNKTNNDLTINGDIIGDRIYNQVASSQSTGSTVNFDTRSNADSDVITLTGDITLNINYIDAVGQKGEILIRQDGTGSRTLTIATFSDNATTGLTEVYSGGFSLINPEENSYTKIAYTYKGTIVEIDLVYYE